MRTFLQESGSIPSVFGESPGLIIETPSMQTFSHSTGWMFHEGELTSFNPRTKHSYIWKDRSCRGRGQRKGAPAGFSGSRSTSPMARRISAVFCVRSQPQSSLAIELAVSRDRNVFETFSGQQRRKDCSLQAFPAALHGRIVLEIRTSQQSSAGKYFKFHIALQHDGPVRNFPAGTTTFPPPIFPQASTAAWIASVPHRLSVSKRTEFANIENVFWRAHVRSRLRRYRIRRVCENGAGRNHSAGSIAAPAASRSRNSRRFLWVTRIDSGSFFREHRMNRDCISRSPSYSTDAVRT